MNFIIVHHNENNSPMLVNISDIQGVHTTTDDKKVNKLEFITKTNSLYIKESPEKVYNLIKEASKI